MVKKGFLFIVSTMDRKEKQHARSTNRTGAYSADNYPCHSIDLQVGVSDKQDCSSIGEHPECVKHGVELRRGGKRPYYYLCMVPN